MYAVVSQKSWNEELARELSSLTGKPFHLIRTRKEFSIEYLNELKPELIFIPHWSYIIPEAIFTKWSCIVFHMTDLPFGRGGSPLQNLIERGFSETKMSALKVNEGLDTGPIYIKKELSLLGTAEEIFLRSNELIKSMIAEIINNDLKPIPQNENQQLEVFKRRKPEQSQANSLDSLERLFDHIRMLDADGYPKAFLETEHFRLELSRASLKANNSVIADVRITKK